MKNNGISKVNATIANLIKKIDELNISIFESIPSQTSAEDRRSLLAVQRATAKKYREYVYLEIGSHLGGSLQTHLVDDRCKKIYSIDPRPSQQPDDRSPGSTFHYDNNSSERMLALLSGIGYGDVSKIECIDLDASKVSTNQIKSNPQLIFIDGEHTKTAVISDFKFSSKVLIDDGVILFHDFYFIYPAIVEICKYLDKQKKVYLPLKLEGSVFALFYDPEMVRSDLYLVSLYNRNKNYLRFFLLKELVKKILPAPVQRAIKGLMRSLKQS